MTEWNQKHSHFATELLSEIQLPEVKVSRLNGTPSLWPIQKAPSILQSLPIGPSTIANAGVHKFHATTHCTVSPNIYGHSVYSLLHVTLLGLRILRWLIDYYKICAPLHQWITRQEIRKTFSHQLTLFKGCNTRNV